MTVLLDTNICIAYLNGTDERIRSRLMELSPSDVVLCSVVKAELVYGARKSERVSENLGRLATFFAAFDSLPFGDLAADHYGVVRGHLEAVGTPVGANDLLIASIALAADATLATRNVGEFRRVPGLRLAEW